ncbi:MAG TPA: AlpA family transcriptional regulator [Rhizomicrobium sp.]
MTIESVVKGVRAAQAAALRNIRLPEVRHKTGLSRPTLYRLIRQGRFPAPGKAGCSSVWLESAVDEWVAACHAARVQAPVDTVAARTARKTKTAQTAEA